MNSYRDIRAFWDTQFEEIFTARAKVEEFNPALSRRLVVALSFAALEATCFFVRNLLKNTFPEEEIQRILSKKEQRILAGLGKDSATDRVVRSLTAAAKLHGNAMNIDPHHPWLPSYRLSVRIRNRLTHPSSPADLELSEKDIQYFCQGITWFIIALGTAFRTH